MPVNDNQIRDYDVVLDAEFGKIGTPERTQAEAEAYSSYTSLLLHGLLPESDDVVLGFDAERGDQRSE